MIATNIRRFVLDRNEDTSGVSGTGTVAEGVEFTNGWIALTWTSYNTSFVFFPSIKELLNVHGHAGRTKVRWLDE